MANAMAPMPTYDASRHRTRGSSVLHRVGVATTHPASSMLVAAVLVAWVAVGVATGFPRWWTTTLYATTASVTLVMVFVIQHTQARLELATQRKLDELLLAVPEADNRLVAAEIATDDELLEITEQHLRHREDPPPGNARRRGDAAPRIRRRA